MPVADPATGEILFDEGHVLTGNDCREMDAIGVGEVSVKLENGDVIRVFTNQMCDMRHYVDFDPREKCGIKERVRFSGPTTLYRPQRRARSLRPKAFSNE